jgi:hypothetical protein
MSQIHIDLERRFAGAASETGYAEYAQSVSNNPFTPSLPLIPLLDAARGVRALVAVALTKRNGTLRRNLASSDFISWTSVHLIR